MSVRKPFVAHEKEPASALQRDCSAAGIRAGAVGYLLQRRRGQLLDRSSVTSGRGNYANPLSDFNRIAPSGGGIDPNSGRVLNLDSFGRIISTSNNPRIVQLALQLHF